VVLQNTTRIVRELAGVSAASDRVFAGHLTLALTSDVAVSFWTSRLAHVEVLGGLTITGSNVRANDINHLLANITRIYGDYVVDATFVAGDGNLSLPNLEMVVGNLKVQSNDQLTEADFPSLQSIGGCLHIVSNAELAAADFLSLQSIGGYLHIDYNAELAAADFSSLQFIGGYLHIDNNAKLAAANFSSLQSIGGYLDIYSNAELAAVDFSSLQSIAESIGGYLHIRTNAKLAAADFSSLQSIGGYLRIDNNAELAAADFSSLQSIGKHLQSDLFTYANGINVCAASTVSNALGHTTLRNVCEGTESPTCTVYRCE
jgi:hypothetical protein